MEVHDSHFYYAREVGSDVFSIIAIRHANTHVAFPASSIEKYSKDVIELFNKLYCASCNIASVTFVFCHDGLQVSYKPNQHGILRMHAVATEPQPIVTREEIDALYTSDLAISTHTLVYDYIQTVNGYFHVGLSLLPCGCICIPLRMTDASISAWLYHWKNCLLQSTKCAVVAFRDRTGLSVQVKTSDSNKFLYRDPTITEVSK